MKPRIGIVIGTTRQGRFADKPAQWIANLAKQRTDMTFETLDLREYPLPHFDEPLPPAWGPAQNPVAKQWAARIAELDGFIIVTAEYNHGPSGALKNALDYAYNEWIRKPVAYVGYGGVGAARAIVHLREVAAELQMATVRNAVHIGRVEFMGMLQQGKTFEDYPHLAEAATAMLDELSWWANALKAARQKAS